MSKKLNFIVFVVKNEQIKKSVQDAIFRMNFQHLECAVLTLEDSAIANYGAFKADINAGKIGLVVAVGGDGTFLTAGRIAHQINCSVIGFNRGTLGFLTAFETSINEDEQAIIERIIQQFEGNRLVHSTRHMVKSVQFPDFYAVNEFVLSPERADKIITYDLYIGDSLSGFRYTGRHKANGVIVAAPTGSSGYALSAGGNLIDPDDSKSIQIVPIAPLSMTSRSIVIGNGLNKVSVRVVFEASKQQPIGLTRDGQICELFTSNDAVDFIVEGSFDMLSSAENSWYSLLSNKLNWNHPSGRIDWQSE